VAGRIADWQRRLESEGSVRLRPSPWLPLLGLAVSVVFTIGAIDSIVDDGPSLWAIAGLVLFGVVGIPLTVRRLVGGRGLTVSAEGIRAGRGPVIPLENVEAVSTRGRNLTIDYRPLPGQRLGLRDRRTGLKQLYASLSPFGAAKPGDLAFWLLQLKAGPDARIDVHGGEGRFAQVYQLAEKPFWER
jgi:hypothetical protein